MELLKTIESLLRGVAVVASQAHNLKVIGSNPVPATNLWGVKLRRLSGFRGRTERSVK